MCLSCDSGEFVDEDLDGGGGGDNNGRNGRRGGRRGGGGAGALAGAAVAIRGDRGRMVERVANRVVRMFMNDEDVSNDGSMDIDNDGDDNADDDDEDSVADSSDTSAEGDNGSHVSSSTEGWETDDD